MDFIYFGNSSDMNGNMSGEFDRVSNARVGSFSLGNGNNMYINKPRTTRSKMIILVFPTLNKKTKVYEKMES